MNLLCCCSMAPSTRVTRKWELFAGRNRFYCDGLLMSAPHTGVFYLTCFLITGTSALFFAFDCPFLATRITPAIPIVGAILYIFTMSSLLRTTFTDPGIIPRASHDEAAYIEKQIEVPNSLNSPTYRPPPRTKEVLVKGQTVKLKYCFTCKIFRPPRASHCSLCDNCVDRFDHHCPWVGNCVGKRNYRFFYMFLVSLAFLAVFIFSCSITHLVLLLKKEKEVLQVIKDAPSSVIVTFICFFSIWSVIGLAGFHTYLTTSDQTTNEDLKGSFTSKGGQRSVNPYSRGNICLNCFYILCGPMTPSLIDRRGIATDEYRQQMQYNSTNLQNLGDQLMEVTTGGGDNVTVGIPSTSKIMTQQPGSIILGGGGGGGEGDISRANSSNTKLFDEQSNPGIYRHRSYDDSLQNGNSNSLARLVDNEIPLSTMDGPITGIGFSDDVNNRNIMDNTSNVAITPVLLNPNNKSFISGATGVISSTTTTSKVTPAITPTISFQSKFASDDENTIEVDDENLLDDNSNSNRNRERFINNHNLSGSYNNLFEDNDDDLCNDCDIMANDDRDDNDGENAILSKLKEDKRNLCTNELGINSNNIRDAHSDGDDTLNYQHRREQYSNTSYSIRRKAHHNQFSPSLSIENNLGGNGNGNNVLHMGKSISESENFYSNLPNIGMNISSNSVTLLVDSENKSDPNLHVYSNLIEEHQKQQEERQQRQQIQSQNTRQRHQELKSTMNNSHQSQLENTYVKHDENSITNVTNLVKTNPVAKATKSSTNHRSNRKSNCARTSNEKNETAAAVTNLSSTLFSDDLDLDDPISAFSVQSCKSTNLMEKSTAHQKNQRSSMKNTKRATENYPQLFDEMISNDERTSEFIRATSSSTINSLDFCNKETEILEPTVSSSSSSMSPLKNFNKLTTEDINVKNESPQEINSTVLYSTSSSSSIGTTIITTTSNLATSSSNRLKILHDTTMIDTALDLDSLDGSSIGNNSQSCLVKTAMV